MQTLSFLLLIGVLFHDSSHEEHPRDQRSDRPGGQEQGGAGGDPQDGQKDRIPYDAGSRRPHAESHVQAVGDKELLEEGQGSKDQTIRYDISAFHPQSNDEDSSRALFDSQIGHNGRRYRPDDPHHKAVQEAFCLFR